VDEDIFITVIFQFSRLLIILSMSRIYFLLQILSFAA